MVFALQPSLGGSLVMRSSEHLSRDDRVIIDTQDRILLLATFTNTVPNNGNHDTMLGFRLVIILSHLAQADWKAVLAQRFKYGTEPPRGMIGSDEHREQGQGLRLGI